MKAADIDLADPTPALLGEEIMMIFRTVAPATLLRSAVGERCRHAKNADHFSAVFGALVGGGWLAGEAVPGSRTVFRLGPNADRPLPPMPQLAAGAQPVKPASALQGLEAPAELPRREISPGLAASLERRKLQRVVEASEAAQKAAIKANPPVKRRLSLERSRELAAKLLALLGQYTGPAPARDLYEPLGVHQTVGSNVLRDLEEAGQVERIGQGSATTWQLTKAARAAAPAVEAPAKPVPAAMPEPAPAATNTDSDWQPEGPRSRCRTTTNGETRSRIEQLLKQSTAPLTAQQVGEHVGIQQSATLYHLRELERIDLVGREGSGNTVRWFSTGRERVTEVRRPATPEIDAADYAMWSDGRLEIRAEALGGAITFTPPAAKALIDYLDRTYRLHLPQAGTYQEASR